MTPQQTIYEAYNYLMQEEARLEDDLSQKRNFYHGNEDDINALTRYYLASKRLEYFRKFSADVRTVFRSVEEQGD